MSLSTEAHPVRPTWAATDANRLFAALEKSLRDSDGPYLVGDLSLADLAFVPTVVRLMPHRPETTAFALTAAWCERL